MRIPDFVPVIESERLRRQTAGFFIEVLSWAYIVLVLGRVIFAQVIMPHVEDLALDNGVVWAQAVVDAIGYDSRDVSFPWWLIFSLLGFGGLVGGIIATSGKGFGTWVASLSKLQVNSPEDSLRIQRHWRFARMEGWLLAILTTVTGWVVTKVNIPMMFEVQGLQGFARLALQLSCGLPLVGTDLGFLGSGSHTIFGGLQTVLNHGLAAANAAMQFFGSNQSFEILNLTCTPPDSQYYGVAISRLSESIYLAFIATVFAIPIAFVLAFFAARNLTKHSRALRLVYVLIRTYMNITRSIEPLIWAILFSVWVGIGPFSGAIALMIHSISSLVKLYSEAIEGVDDGPLEALQASGANRVAMAWFAVVPQVTMPYLAFTIYRWDINVRMATIIGLVGGGGIGGLLIQEQGLANWTAVGTIAFLIFLVVWTMDFVSARVREAIH
jgi:phosphonate transport system permease protein